jgi:hypothetical protein
MASQHLAGRISIRLLTIAALTFAAGYGPPANAGSLSERDVQILAKVIGFLEPPPSGAATIGIAYDPASAASKRDAEEIASYFGEGLKGGSAFLKPKLTTIGDLANGGFVAVIAAAGAKVEKIYSVTKSLHVACVTANTEDVQVGQCLVAVKSAPKVEILINRAAAASSGVGFGSAFLLMAHEI